MKRSIILISLLVLLALISCSSNTKKLYVFNWTDYIEPELIKQFEKQYHCKVIYDTYNSNENMLTKIMTSQAAYDIIVPSGDHVNILMQKGLIEPIDHTKLTNYKNLDPVILKKAEEFDPKNQYSIPYFWGTCGIIYNKQYIKPEKMQNVSWNIFADPMFKGKNAITVLDDAREVIGISLITNNLDPNVFSENNLATAKTTLLSWDKNISQYDSDSFKNEVQDGTVWLAQAYNGDALQVMQENSDIGFTLPKEGSTLWIDFIAIPKNAENKDLAYKFIDFMLDANNAKINATFVQYATPNKEAFKLLPEALRNNKSIYPSDEYLSHCYLLKNVGNEVLKVDKLWQLIRNN